MIYERPIKKASIAGSFGNRGYAYIELGEVIVGEVGIRNCQRQYDECLRACHDSKSVKSVFSRSQLDPRRIRMRRADVVQRVYLQEVADSAGTPI